jgi:predicted transcriptional regulator
VGRKYKPITVRKLEVLSARVNYDLYKEVESLADTKDQTMTQILRAALREYIDRHQQKAA